VLVRGLEAGLQGDIGGYRSEPPVDRGRGGYVELVLEEVVAALEAAYTAAGSDLEAWPLRRRSATVDCSTRQS
jgi:hypothetical protein